MKKATIILSLLFFVSQSSKAQTVAFYPFNSVFAISTNTNNPFWCDFRFQTNSYFSSLSTEIAPQFTIVNRFKAIYYIGGGARINFLGKITDSNASLLQGYFIDAGVRITPFEKVKGAQILFELSPYADSKFETGLLIARLGLAYNFDYIK